MALCACTGARADVCNDEAPSALLRAPATALPDARAVALDGRSLRWPGVAAEGRFELRRTLHGRDVAWPLQPRAAQPGRAPWTGAGVELTLPPAPAARLRDLHRGLLSVVQLDAAGRELQRTGLQAALALDDLFAEPPAPLGATVERGRTVFRLWAPTAQRVALCLYADDRGPATRRVPMQRDAATGTWAAQVPGNLSGGYYAYAVDVVAPGHGLVRNRVTDPYAATLGADSRRAMVADLDAPRFKPPGWDAAPRPAPLAAMTDLVVYELHVRDFSRDDATVPAADRGKYLGFAHPASDGMRHLKALAEAGVTDVHLLPAFDIATVPEVGCVTPVVSGAPDGTTQQAAVRAVAARDCYNWGYDPWHFNAPEGSYASRADDGAVRVREFRAMVQALHAAGLRVGMDVVYNHMTASGQHDKSVLDRIVPGYYHRLDAKGAVERSTCCDNTATEHRMMARLMIDSAVHWVRHYRIDSYRFDLMGHQPRAAMERLQKAVDAAAGRRVPLIGEGWNFGEVADGRRFVQASQLSLQGSGIATFSDRARDALRGGGAGDDGVAQIARQGWLNGLHFAPNAEATADRAALLRAADLVRAGLAGTLRDYRLTAADGGTRTLAQLDYAGQSAGYVAEPGEVVNYVENHDNQTLYDAHAFKLPAGTSREDRARVQVLGAAAVLFSQGVAYLHAGQELLRSKSMDRNSYDSGDWFNRIDWSARDNFFGTGLPPEPDNGRSWPLMAPRLADPGLRPTPAEIAFTRDAVLDLLRIRSGTTLLRLRSAADVQARLAFHGAGPAQSGTLVVATVDGGGLPGAAFASLLYAINVAPEPQVLELPPAARRDWRLHPVLAAPQAADRRAAEAAWDAASGRLRVPARTAVVFIAP